MLRLAAVLTLLVAFPLAADAQGPADRALVEALRGGGYVLYFRHAATDWGQEDRIEKDGDWSSCDASRMRQLSEAGRATARRIGEAIRTLGIPVARVRSSEYCRAAETARQMGLGPVETTRDIMNLRAADYVGGAAAATRRARRVLSEPPPPGSNAVVVGHGNLMRAATGSYTGEGGAGVFRPAPGTERDFEEIAQIAPDDWSRLAAQFAR